MTAEGGTLTHSRKLQIRTAKYKKGSLSVKSNKLTADMENKRNFKCLTLPLSAEDAEALRAGDYVRLYGTLYTARDAAHKRMYACIAEGAPLPVNLSGQAIYYVGPCFSADGKPTGAGPTTSGRMDAYAPALYDCGVRATIGKGDRSPAVYEAIKRNNALYLCAVGGAGALYAKAITSFRTAAYDDLGTEAIRQMEVKDFPVIVGIDSRGESIFAKI